MGMGKVNFKQLKQLQKDLIKCEQQLEQNIETVANQIADEYIEQVKARTPVTNTNELRNNWKKEVTSDGKGDYFITISNDTEYASQVEYGSKTADGGFKQGKFMLHITEQEMEKRVSKLVDEHMTKTLKGVFK